MERVKQLNYFLKIVGETKVLANHVILNKQVAMKVATLHKIKGPLRLQELEAQVCWLLQPPTLPDQVNIEQVSPHS